MRMAPHASTRVALAALALTLAAAAAPIKIVRHADGSMEPVLSEDYSVLDDDDGDLLANHLLSLDHSDHTVPPHIHEKLPKMAAHGEAQDEWGEYRRSFRGCARGSIKIG